VISGDGRTEDGGPYEHGALDICRCGPNLRETDRRRAAPAGGRGELVVASGARWRRSWCWCSSGHSADRRRPGPAFTKRPVYRHPILVKAYRPLVRSALGWQGSTRRPGADCGGRSRGDSSIVVSRSKFGGRSSRESLPAFTERFGRASVRTRARRFVRQLPNLSRDTSSLRTSISNSPQSPARPSRADDSRAAPCPSTGWTMNRGFDAPALVSTRSDGV
jgi:hypothetical protein